MLRRYFGKISSLGINQLVGHNGELVIDELTDKIYIMDGVTPGGYEIANIQHYGSKIFFDNGGTIGPTNDGDNNISVAATDGMDWTEINYADQQIVRANNYSVSILTSGPDNYQWIYDSQGQLIFPGGATINNNLGTLSFNAGADTHTMQISAGTNSAGNGADLNLYSGTATEEGLNGNINLFSNEINLGVNGNEFNFNQYGSLKFPQGTLLGYSDPGGFIIDGAVDKDIAIYTYNGANAHGWTFGTDGSLTIPNRITTPSMIGDGSAGANLYIGAGPVTGSNATGGSTIIQGGHGDPGTGGSGPVQIQTGSDTGNPNFKFTWTFDQQGRLLLPNAYSSGGTLMSQDGFSFYNTNTFQYPRLDTANIIVPPKDSNNPIQFNNTIGNIQLTSGTNKWKFDATGILNLPNNNGQIGQLEQPYTGLEFRTGSGADWIGISYGEIADNNTSYFYFDKDGTDYQIADHQAHLQLKNPTRDGHVEWLFKTDGSITFPDNTVQTTAYTDFGSNSLISGDSAQYVVNLDNDGILHLSGTAQGEYESAIVAPNLQLDGSIVENIGSSYINIFGNTVVQGGNLALSGLFDDSYLWLVNTDNAIHTHSDTGMGGHATTEYRNMGGYLEGGRGHRFYTGGTWDQQQLRFAIADDGILVPGDMYLTGQIRDFTGRNLLNPLNLNIDAGDSSTVYDTTDLIIDGGNS
jgi:hypothetical protein